MSEQEMGQIMHSTVAVYDVKLTNAERPHRALQVLHIIKAVVYPAAFAMSVPLSYAPRF